MPIINCIRKYTNNFINNCSFPMHQSSNANQCSSMSNPFNDETTGKSKKREARQISWIPFQFEKEQKVNQKPPTIAIRFATERM